MAVGCDADAIQAHCDQRYNYARGELARLAQGDSEWAKALRALPEGEADKLLEATARIYATPLPSQGQGLQSMYVESIQAAWLRAVEAAEKAAGGEVRGVAPSGGYTQTQRTGGAVDNLGPRTGAVRET